MHDAAVGFQCPSCVAEGAKSTRAGRTAYGGIRSGNPAATSMALIGLNVLVWLSIVASGWRASPLVGRLALLPVGECESRATGGYYRGVTSAEVCSAQAGGDGRWISGVSEGAYWQLLTSAFAHVEPWHIGFNMLALWFLGPQLEMVLGRVRFLALYLISALAGSTLVYWASGELSATLGASGATFGLMGALLVVAFKVGGDVRGILIWLALNAVLTFVFPNVSWQGHLGGFLGGVAIAGILVYAPRQRRPQVQVAGLVSLTVLLVAAVVARTVVLV